MSFPLPSRRDQSKPAAQAQDLTISDALDRWIRITGKRWSKKRLANAERCVRSWLELLPACPISNLSTLEVEELYACREARSTSGYWLNLERQLFKQFWKWARAHQLVIHDPCDVWPRVVEIPQRQYAAISREEEEGLCTTIADGGLWSRLNQKRRVAVVRYIRVAIGTGLRKGTIYALKWKYLDPLGVLEIPGSILKARKPLRMPLTDRLLKIIGARGDPEASMILGLPPPESINRILKTAARHCGMNPQQVYPHQFRLTWVSRLHDAGIPMAQVRLLGGWASESVILKSYYAPISDEQARSIMERI